MSAEDPSARPSEATGLGDAREQPQTSGRDLARQRQAAAHATAAAATAVPRLPGAPPPSVELDAPLNTREEREAWAANMRRMFSPPAMVKADGSINQEYFRPRGMVVAEAAARAAAVVATGAAAPAAASGG